MTIQQTDMKWSFFAPRILHLGSPTHAQKTLQALDVVVGEHPIVIPRLVLTTDRQMFNPYNLVRPDEVPSINLEVYTCLGFEHINFWYTTIWAPVGFFLKTKQTAFIGQPYPETKRFSVISVSSLTVRSGIQSRLVQE